MRRIIILISLFLLTSIAWGQQPAGSNAPAAPQSMPGTDMSDHGMSGMQMGGNKNKDDASVQAMHSMERHMDMGPHMKMTALRPSKPGDAERAQRVAEAARKVADRYVDYHVALADGFKIFLPHVPQNIYHFTNYQYARQNAVHFDASRPTSLLYEKHGDDYKLVGVMYTASKTLSEEKLDEFIPLSVAQWHEHVNFCSAPWGRKLEAFRPNPEFGFKGSIHTQEACDAAGGTFHPVVLDWMVHVYPFEKAQAAIWSVERNHAD